MSDKLSKEARARAARWLTCALICSHVVAPWRAAHAQSAGTEAEADAEAPQDGAPAGAPSGDAEDEAALAEADAAAMSEDESAALDELRRPPSKGKGVVWGTVKDTKFNEGVIDANVQVVGRKEKTFADVNGGYRLELPPGKYSLRVSFELHQPARVDEVVVKAGAVDRIDFNLVPDETSVEEVVVEDEADLTSTEGQNLGRKRSAVVGDGVGRAEIARTPDRNAAEAAQRVVGATIVDGRFVFVRGLGERYTNALLNGSPLPSTEPDRNTVPLDLFPSLVLESLTIVKQFTPDMPADFAGGSVRVATREFPKQPLFQLSVSGGYNTEGTFRSRPTYYGSSREWLGFDGGRRALPEGIPNRKLTASGTPAAEQEAYAHRLNSAMGTQREVSPPNFGASVVAGNAYKLGSDSKVGGMVALTYGRSYQLRQLTARRFYSAPLPDGSPTLLVGDEFRGQQGIDTARWGLFGSAALESTKNHTFRLVVLRSQAGEDQTTDLEGSYRGSPEVYHTDHLEYVTRSLSFLQLGGSHRFPKQRDLEIEWHTSAALADRDQPDTRDTRYLRTARDGVAGWSFVPDSSGLHHYLAQQDRTFTGGLDITQPLITTEPHRTSLKVGTLITSRRREFNARRFQLEPSREPDAVYDALSFCPGAAWDPGCPNRLFRQEGIGPGRLQLDEWTLRFDQYETGLDVYSVYGMIDAKPLEKLRATAGVRTEITYQAFSGFDPFDRAGTEKRSNIYRADYLPALSLVYAASTKVNARLGLSQTLARPQLRELSPALSTNYSGDLPVQGNPELTLTKITNADARIEYFPTLKEVLAFSFFYKRFKDPIEEIIGGTGFLGFANAPKADLYGIELEGRKTLDILAPPLNDFTLIANLTVVKSQVELGDSQLNATSAKRPLSYQSPYVVNLALDYEYAPAKFDVRILYNVFGPRITVVGANDLPDTYELPRHQLDVTAAKGFGKHFQIKLQGQNLLAAPIVFAYRDQDAYRLVNRADGSSVYQSLGRTPAVKRYDPGMLFTLTATYTY